MSQGGEDLEAFVRANSDVVSMAPDGQEVSISVPRSRFSSYRSLLWPSVGLAWNLREFLRLAVPGDRLHVGVGLKGRILTLSRVEIML